MLLHFLRASPTAEGFVQVWISVSSDVIPAQRKVSNVYMSYGHYLFLVNPKDLDPVQEPYLQPQSNPYVGHCAHPEVYILDRAVSSYKPRCVFVTL